MKKWKVSLTLVLNGQLYYPADLDRPLNEVVSDKIPQHRVDYNNRPSHVISFIPTSDGSNPHEVKREIRLGKIGTVRRPLTF